MRDPQAEKRRTMRQQYRSGHGPQPWRMYERLYPEPKGLWRDSLAWDAYWMEKYAWMDKVCGGPHYNPSDPGPDKNFRQGYNRSLRARQRQALREAIRDNELEDFFGPPFIRTARWDWW